MTLLSIAQDITGEIGLPQPTAIIGSTDDTAIQLLTLANKSGKRLMREFDWEELMTEGSFTTVATESQGAMTTIASDFDRWVNDTLYNRDKTWKVFGPLSAQAWQREKGTVASTIFDTFRIRGGNLIMTPVPTAGEDLYFEYISNKWAESSGGTAQTSFQADTDVARIDEDLLTLDVKWRFLKAKGLDYGEEFREFQLQHKNRKLRDGGAEIINIGDTRRSVLDPRLRTPEGNWLQ